MCDISGKVIFANLVFVNAVKTWNVSWRSDLFPLTGSICLMGPITIRTMRHFPRIDQADLSGGLEDPLEAGLGEKTMEKCSRTSTPSNHYLHMLPIIVLYICIYIVCCQWVAINSTIPAIPCIRIAMVTAYYIKLYYISLEVIIIFTIIVFFLLYMVIIRVHAFCVCIHCNILLF